MEKQSFQIIGHVIDQNTRDGVDKLRVEAWDKDLLVDDLVGSTMTDERGAFRLEITADYFSELFLDRQPDLYFKVFQGQTLIKSTEDSVLWNVGVEETKVTIEVDLPSPQPREYVIDGQVSRPDKTMVVDVVVQAFDVSTNSEQHLGKAITDAKGNFKINYSGEPSEARGGADLIVRVFDAQGGVLATSAIIRKAKPVEQVSLVTNGKLPVDKLPVETLPIKEKPFVVRGTVREENGKLAAGVSVRAFDRDLRSEEPLGNASADSKGSYEIHYSPEQFQRAEKDKADLLVRAYDSEGTELAASAILFNASSVEVIDLTIENDKPGKQSEYERHMAELNPLLEDVPLARLTAEDIAFLKGETGVDGQHIAYLVSSEIWSPDTGVQPAALYGLQRSGLPATLPELLAESEQRQRSALESAISSNIIPLSVKDEIDSILARLHHSFVKRIIQQPNANGEVTMGRVLEGALPSPELQAAFVSASITHSQSGGATQSFWDKLRGDSRFASEDIESIQFTVHIAALTSNHAPLIEALQKKRRDGELTSLRDMARLDASDWEDLIQKTANGSGLPPGVPGEDAAEKARNFAATIASSVELQFPTAVMANRLGRDDGFAMPHKTTVATFLDGHTDFEFGTTNITSYLVEHEETAFKGVADRQGFADQLEKMQRVAHVAPRYDQMRTLITKGLDSSLAISRFSPERFASDYAKELGGTAVAYAIHDAAGQKTATTNTLLADARSLVAGTSLAVLPILDQAKKIADLRTLFGSVDFCDCSECRSVLSPAAYLVDVLEFLKHRNSEPDPSRGQDPRSVRDILFRRRPDIGEIELTCQNTNTPVPYLDLVNEILENAVAPIVQPDDWHHLPLSPDKHAQFQTRLSAEELSAYPEHVNSHAYEVLRDASFPWSLPFDLWMEETRAYLSHLGTTRADLIATFRPPARPPAAGDASASAAIARDTLGLTPKAWDAIANTSLSRVAQDWGDGLGWPDADFGDVRSFLERSGLTYAELTDLLDTRYINPNPANRDVDIEPRGSCDIGGMRLTGITDQKGIMLAQGSRILSRTQRFVRLWRTLGWTMRELDTSTRALAAPDLDQTFLLRLSDLRRVQTRLGVPLAQVLSLYADLDTDGPDALYNVVFRSPAMLSQFKDPAFDLAHLPITGGTDKPISQHEPTIRAALNIVSSDLAPLLAALHRSMPSPAPSEPGLTLRNLSFLYRHTFLSKVLQLEVEQLTTLLTLTGIDPFNKDDIAGTLRFVDTVRTIRESGFTIDELVYLFGVTRLGASRIAPSADSIAQALESIRATLSITVSAAAVSLDDKEKETGELLTTIGWNPAVTDQVAMLLANRGTYARQLPPLLDFPIPPTLVSKVSYDRVNGVLRFSGVMTETERRQLIDNSGLTGNEEIRYRKAVEELFDEPRQFARAALAVIVYRTPLDTLPSALHIPSGMTTRLIYDNDARSLQFAGPMTDDEQRTLKSLSDDIGFRNAIDRLHGARFEREQPAETTFLSHVAIEGLMGDISPSARFDILLEQLGPYVSRMLWTGSIVQSLSKSLDLEPDLLRPLLTRYLHRAGSTGHSMIEDFLDFGNLDRTVGVTDRDPFSNAFQAYRRLHKVALILSKFGASHRELQWLFRPVDHTDTGLERVGTGGYETTEGFRMWSRLVDLVRLRNRFGVDGLDRIMTSASGTATASEIIQAISNLGTWRSEDVQSIANHLGLSRLQLGDDRALARLSTCCDSARRLGVTLEQCWSWTEPDLASPEQIAEETRQALKARYSNEQWIAVSKPLRDTLRVRQSAALVSYLLAHPPAALLAVDPPIGLAWRTPGDLYAYFLIDVEMGSCAMTSRIKLAHSSIQLFVQRCLLDIEPEVRADSKQDSAWLQWDEWMKNYRVWEANRRIFLYPENWVEPELRDDKTPLFKDLESELLQNDPTTETTEAAFANYFETLDTIARPEIVAMYRESGEPSILHVFGRTRGTSHVYYYRRQITTTYGSSWTSWEKINVDIEGDHLVPVVWNSRLYLFWPTFIEQTERQQASMPGEGDPIPEPKKYRKMQLAWSQYRNNKWTAKSLSRESARIPSDGSVELYFLASPSDGGDLVVRCIARVGRAFEIFARITPPVTKLIDFRFAGSDGTVRRMPLQDGNFIRLLPGTHLEGMTFVEDGNWGFPILGEAGKAIQDALHGLRDFFGASLDGALVPFGSSTETSDIRDAWKPLESQESRSPIASLLIAASQPLVNIPFPDVRANDRLELSMRLFRTRMQPLLERLPVSADAPNLFRVLLPYYNLASVDEFFFQDDTRTFFVDMSPDQPMLQEVLTRLRGLDPDSREYCTLLLMLGLALGSTLQYQFNVHYHPFVRVLMQKLNQEGIDGLMGREVQRHPELVGTIPRAYNFVEMYGPNTACVRVPGPTEEIDFSPEGAYSQYNWELFFHAPLLIAGKLSANQRFAEAQKWYHYIFDPTDKSSVEPPQRYWRTRRFFETTAEEYQQQRIDSLLRGLSATHDRKLDNQVQQWRENPFNPHLVARLRTTAFQKTVVMKYLDNLIAWGDQLFRRDTLESINEATQLYMLASEILGPRPQRIRPRTQPQTHTYNSLAGLLDSFSNALVRAENVTPPPAARPTSTGRASASNGGAGTRAMAVQSTVGQSTSSNGGASARGIAIQSSVGQSTSVPKPGDDRLVPPKRTMMPPLPPALYFCVPSNDKLLAYWDRVADRLFKVRHCMNIEGVLQQLPLFEPEIDPALLVRGRAAGIDMRSLMSETGAGPPLNYRFTVLAQKAGELCADVRGLGAALLSAFEKRDAEALALLRSGHELAMLSQMEKTKEYQIEEATRALEGMRKSREATVLRRDHYASLAFMSPGELAHLALMTQSLQLQINAAELDHIGNVLHVIPNFKGAFFTSIGMTFGGENLGNAVQAFSRYMSAQASILGAVGGMSATLEGYRRRSEEWGLQIRLAEKELEQIDKQIIAAEIRVAIARQDLRMHLLHAEQTRQADEFMRTKFTNRELYDWMGAQLSAVYFQSYQMAYDIAKRAERAYQYERGIASSAIVQFGHWDSLHKGLLAGERLHLELKRLEIAYLDQNKREFEITKHISLAQLDPIALLRLKQTGECLVSVPEALFDIDFAGHYLRRIKALNVTIPCVTGPYTGINCTLTLLKNSVRHSSDLDSGRYGRRANGEDSRFTERFGAIQSMVTSSGQNDGGLFEQNLHDERYLPFEGNGAISEWRIELPKQFRQFDYDTISDVVLHMRYTARDGSATLKQPAAAELLHAIEAMELEEDRHGRFRLFSVKHEFPTEWHRFQQPGDSTATQLLHLDITSERFPMQTKYLPIQITRIDVFVKMQGEDLARNVVVQLGVSTPSSTFEPAEGPSTGPQLWHAEIANPSASDAPVNLSSRWTLEFKATTDDTVTAYRFPHGAPDDILIVCGYTASSASPPPPAI